MDPYNSTFRSQVTFYIYAFKESMLPLHLFNSLFPGQPE